MRLSLWAPGCGAGDAPGTAGQEGSVRGPCPVRTHTAVPAGARRTASGVCGERTLGLGGLCGSPGGGRPRAADVGERPGPRVPPPGTCSPR